MNSVNSFNSAKGKDRPLLLGLCLLLSLILHLLAIIFLPQQSTPPSELSQANKPTIVRLVDKASKDQKQSYELDQRPQPPVTELPPEAARLAEQQQRVDQEMAPKGDDVRDQAAQPATSQPANRPPARKPATAPKPRPQKTTPRTDLTPKTQPKRSTAEQYSEPPRQPEQARPAPPADAPPSLAQLTQLPPTTLSRIASSNQAAMERLKQRADVEAGDTVWLNLERGTLISFFRRFRNQIEGVWNYPREAIEKEMQGILLLKITINRKGELLDVELMQTSGYELLDYEAIQAVYRAAPFGPLGKHYPYPDLKIMANFSYTISGKYIYGQRR